MRLVYASKYILWMLMFPLLKIVCWLTGFINELSASWAISVYYAYQRTWKPFNPILGETYEMTNHGGITFISEQASLWEQLSCVNSFIVSVFSMYCTFGHILMFRRAMQFFTHLLFHVFSPFNLLFCYCKCLMCIASCEIEKAFDG